MKISIITHGFIRWGGGVDFVKFISTALDSVSNEYESEQFIIIPSNDFQSKIVKLIYPFKMIFDQLTSGLMPKWKVKSYFSESYYENSFSDIKNNFIILQGGSLLRSQLSTAVKSGADIVFPCMAPLNKNFVLPWIGYLPDFQHKYLPEFFSTKEIEERNKNFQYMLETASDIIVNAHSVKSDIEFFYPNHKAIIHVLPFSPFPQKSWLNDTIDARLKYEINKPYFMICNQFWRHKNHLIAFKAFAKYVQNGGDAILVCTGATDDYRFPEYYEEIQALIEKLDIASHIKILGHIPKMEQISLMKDTLAVIQPTLFEGGPGGGASYNAIALGVPVIVSDIKVNLEINCGNVTFFKSNDYISLAQVLLERGTDIIQRPSNKFLSEVGLQRQRHCGRVLMEILQCVHLNKKKV